MWCTWLAFDSSGWPLTTLLIHSMITTADSSLQSRQRHSCCWHRRRNCWFLLGCGWLQSYWLLQGSAVQASPFRLVGQQQIPEGKFSTKLIAFRILLKFLLVFHLLTKRRLFLFLGRHDQFQGCGYWSSQWQDCSTSRGKFLWILLLTFTVSGKVCDTHIAQLIPFQLLLRFLGARGRARLVKMHLVCGLRTAPRSVLRWLILCVLSFILVCFLAD